MARRGVFALAVFPLAALAQAAPQALAAAERRLQQNGQPAYCNSIFATNFDGRDWGDNLNEGGGLSFYNVARQSENTPLNLVVTPTTRYEPVQATGNQLTTGVVGNIGQIAMYSDPTDPTQQPYGQCFDFHYENNNGNRVSPGNTILTFLDADNLQDGCREVYRICDNNVEFITSSNSGLRRTSDGTCTEFFSQNSNVNNPTNSQALTPEQQAAGFGVRFSNSLNVCMRLEGDQCEGTNRQLMFSGMSNIDNCPSTLSTSSSASTGTASTAAPAACSSTCTFSGRTATCQELFSSVQSNGVPGSSDSMLASSVPCANAWATVVDSCNVCSGCSLNHVCQGVSMFELGPSALPRPAAGSRAGVVTVAGLSACLVALAAALALGRARPAPVATGQGAAEAEPKQPLVQELWD